MTKHSWLLRCACSGVLGLASASVGVALAADAGGLEEVVVTAQKRTESLQEIPIAVSAYSDKMRDLVGITTVQDLVNFTPGILYSSSVDRMYMRGVGRQTNNLSTSPGVASYGDGFYNSSNHEADVTQMFTERVEVLRGPQGTLYGRNSIGGAINVITKRPKDQWGGEARVAGGSFDSMHGEALITGPITDWLRFSVGGGEYKQDKGYVDNVNGPDNWDEFGRKDNKYAVVQFAGSFGSALDFWVKYRHTEWDEGTGSFVTLTPYVTRTVCTPAALTPGVTQTNCSPSLIAAGSLGPSSLYNTGLGFSRTAAGVAANPAFDLRPAALPYSATNPGVTDPRQTRHNTQQHDSLLPDNTVVLELVGHLPFADLKYVGGWHDYIYKQVTDFDNSDRVSYQYTPRSGLNPVTIFSTVNSFYEEDKHYYSNELNLISTSEGALKWLVGAFQYNEHYEQPTRVDSPFQTQLYTPVATTAGQPVAPNPNGSFTTSDAFMTNTSAAIFSQVDYSFTDAWTATVGLRYTKDKKYGTEFSRRIRWDPTTAGALAPATDLTGLCSAAGGLTFFDPVMNPACATVSPAGTPTAARDGSGFYSRKLANENHATTGTAGVAWKPFTGANGYLKYTRGYKDGAISAGNLSQFPYAKPEFMDAYELGWKQDIGNRFDVNVAVFLEKVKDMQIPLTVINPPAPSITSTFNLDAQSSGIEIESNWQATDNLAFLLNYAYLDAHVTDKENCFSDSLDASGIIGPDLCATGGHKVDGNQLPGSPKNRVSANGRYTFNFSPGSLTFSANWIWREGRYSTIFRRLETHTPGFDQIDLRAIWVDTDNRYSVIGFVRNLQDRPGYDGSAAAVTTDGISRSVSLTNPREWGLELQYRFGSQK